jgi:hypothetical protein
MLSKGGWYCNTNGVNGKLARATSLDAIYKIMDFTTQLKATK